MAGKDSKEDKDALDALEAEAKEFDKVRCERRIDIMTTANPATGCRDRPNFEGVSTRRVSAGLTHGHRYTIKLIMT